MSYPEFFSSLFVDGRAPYPYQRRLAGEPWPQLLDVPTGLGKTAAVVVAWLYRRLVAPEATPRRLVYCLPMRTLVAQTLEAIGGWLARAEPVFARAGQPLPTLYGLLGGAVDDGWLRAPDLSAVVVGTQDMVLSRALNRGYALSRYQWPMAFGALHTDAQWVLDETQLMGVGVETSAQLEGLRRRLGGDATTLWMSATLGARQLGTVDHPEPAQGWRVLALGGEDLADPGVVARVGAHKALSPTRVRLEPGAKGYAAEVGQEVLAAHRPGTLSLVILNRVARAQAVYQWLKERSGRPAEGLALVHARFREAERRRMEARLLQGGDVIVVATQAVEAGLDVSASQLFTELAPWPSLVQRMGRCNRDGRLKGARVQWIDVATQDQALCLPYEGAELDVARGLLGSLRGEACPAALRAAAYTPPRVTRPILRARDLLELFDTSPDLAGQDLDVGRYIREVEDSDVHVYWRDVPDGVRPPPPERGAPTRAERCAVPVWQLAEMLKKAAKKSPEGARAWRWSPVDGEWRPLSPTRPGELRPGQTVLLDLRCGGYDPERGWTGEPGGRVPPVEVAPPEGEGAEEGDQDQDDPLTTLGRWVELTTHLGHVEAEARALTRAIGLPPKLARSVEIAAAWHDVGKAHDTFQGMLRSVGEPPDPAPLYAKSAAGKGKYVRPHFRHELASALAWLACGGELAQALGVDLDLVAYLIAAHHGKIRVSLRALPGEERPPEVEGQIPPFARGVWQGDVLPPVALPGGGATPQGLTLDLSCIQMGEGSWLGRVLALRDSPEVGPLRLAWLELLVRAADWRASRLEEQGAYHG